MAEVCPAGASGERGLVVWRAVPDLSRPADRRESGRGDRGGRIACLRTRRRSGSAPAPRKRPIGLRPRCIASPGVPRGPHRLRLIFRDDSKTFEFLEAVAMRARVIESPTAIDLPMAELTVLGLAWPCVEAEVKVAFRRLALLEHPDQGGSLEAASCDCNRLMWRFWTIAGGGIGRPPPETLGRGMVDGRFNREMADG